MKAFLVVLAAAATLALPAAAADGSREATTTISCNQVWVWFNVQLLGDRDWGWNLSGLGQVGAPKKQAIIVVWSLGGKQQGGINAYSWSTARRSRPSPACKVITPKLKAPSLAGLRPAVKVKDGWAFGRKFGCVEKGPILITTTQSGGKTGIVVRVQRSGQVIAVGELGSGGGWIRGSTRCDNEEK